jgi:hypothetical protein
MLFRICLIAAIVFGLAVTGLNLAVVKDKINNLSAERQQEHDTRVIKEKALADTTKELKKTQGELKTTKDNLATTTAEKEKALADLDAQTKRGDKLTDDLKKTRADLDDAQANLEAYRITGYTPPQILAMGKEYKDLTNQLAEATMVNKAQGQKIVSLQNQLDRYVDPNKPVTLPPTAKGKVLISDPKWNFVVLSFGQEQGALQYGEVLVNRNGKLVAKVVISSVQKDRCVANIMPGWELGDVLEGDLAIPAHPSS